MQTLQAMFSDVDREIIHNILYQHQGKLDPTIEDLLKLTNDAVEEENIFEEGSKNKPNENYSGFQDNTELARKKQEEEDMKLAMQLQQQENQQQMPMMQQSYPNMQQSYPGGARIGLVQQPTVYYVAQPQPRFVQPLQPNYMVQYQQTPIQYYQYGQQTPVQYQQPQQQLWHPQQPYQQQYQQPPQYLQQSQYQPQQQYMQQSQYQGSMQQSALSQQQKPDLSSIQSQSKEEKKPKKNFSQKMKDAKMKFFSMFKKNKKKVGSNEPDCYFAIDNLDDMEVVNFNNGGENSNLEVYNDLDQIPDLDANPYSMKPMMNASDTKKLNVPRNNEESIVDIDDIDERDPAEEAKTNFRLAQPSNINKPMFDGGVQEERGENYIPLIGEVLDEDDMREVYTETKLGYKVEKSLI